MAKRIYIARVGNTVRLVRAHHPSAVAQHVARDMVRVSVATQDELVDALGRGIKPEDTGQEQPPLIVGGGGETAHIRAAEA